MRNQEPKKKSTSQVDNIRTCVMAGRVISDNLGRIRRAKRSELIKVPKPSGYDDIKNGHLRRVLRSESLCYGLNLIEVGEDTVTFKKAV